MYRCMWCRRGVDTHKTMCGRGSVTPRCTVRVATLFGALTVDGIATVLTTSITVFSHCVCVCALCLVYSKWCIWNSLINMRTCTCTHTYTHTHTRKHTHPHLYITHTHTHTYSARPASQSTKHTNANTCPTLQSRLIATGYITAIPHVLTWDCQTITKSA